jgi:hypothetical protein
VENSNFMFKAVVEPGWREKLHGDRDSSVIQHEIGLLLSFLSLTNL